jgi:hypothetical protein
MVIISGWKEIAFACGFKTRKTIKRKARKYKMPIVYMDRTPTITRKALEEWWEAIQRKAATS